MGDPKHLRSRIEGPLKAWDSRRIEAEKAILKEFGLRRKNELRRAEAVLRAFRTQARHIGATKDQKLEKDLIAKMARLNLVGDKANLDDVLGLTVNDILSRRLQTVILRKGLANSHKQARQLITHRHVVVGEKTINRPSFIVPKEFDGNIKVVGVEVQPKKK